MMIFSRMRLYWTLAPLLACFTHTSLAEASDWKKFPPAEKSDEATNQWLPLDLGAKAALVSDTAKRTTLLGFFPKTPLTAQLTPEKSLEAGAILLSEFKDAPPITLSFAWLGNDVLEDRGHAVHASDGRFRSVYRVRSTTIFRTVLASKEDGVVYVHFHADQPGALSFKTTLSAASASTVKIEDRRQLILTPDSNPETNPAAHVWVIPYESDVSGNEDAISLMGEGEALIVFALSPDGNSATELAKTWEKIGERYDPGHSPPNPSKVWQGVLEAHQKSAENSP